MLINICPESVYDQEDMQYEALHINPVLFLLLPDRFKTQEMLMVKSFS